MNQVTWILLAGGIIGFISKLINSGRIVKIPGAYIPWIALALGIGSAALQFAVQGSTWPVAIVQALGAAAIPVLGHETVVEGILKGKLNPSDADKLLVAPVPTPAPKDQP